MTGAAGALHNLGCDDLLLGASRMKGSGLGYFSAVISVRTISSGKILKCVGSPHLACVKRPRQQNDHTPLESGGWQCLKEGSEARFSIHIFKSS